MDGPSRSSPRSPAPRVAPDLGQTALGVGVLAAVVLAALAGIPPYALAFVAAAGVGLTLWGLFPRRAAD